jgi:hypothetical protein
MTEGLSALRTDCALLSNKQKNKLRGIRSRANYIDRHLPEKLVQTFADIGYRVVSATDSRFSRPVLYSPETLISCFKYSFPLEAE